MIGLALNALSLSACGSGEPAERYGFIARLGRDTVSVEAVTRQGNRIISDAVDRFPRVRMRHTEIELDSDGGVRRLVMDISTPSEPANQRERRVTVDVDDGTVSIRKKDGSGTLNRTHNAGGSPVLAHVPQMYSLYEQYFVAARGKIGAPRGDDTARMRQFYIDREFDRFTMHNANVRLLRDGRAEVWHDWLAGVGEATLDSAGRLLRYSGARTTYLVDVERLAEAPDVAAIGAQLAAAETKAGFAQLSVRDTLRARIGAAEFTVDYGRPLARGRELLGKVIPYDRVWRTGANAATQFTTSAPITIGPLKVPAGSYTLWTIPRENGSADLIINRQTGQWGTGYDRSRDLGTVRMRVDSVSAPVEKFTITIEGGDGQRGTLSMAWGTFRWTVPLVLDASAR